MKSVTVRERPPEHKEHLMSSAYRKFFIAMALFWLVFGLGTATGAQHVPRCPAPGCAAVTAAVRGVAGGVTALQPPAA